MASPEIGTGNTEGSGQGTYGPTSRIYFSQRLRLQRLSPGLS